MFFSYQFFQEFIAVMFAEILFGVIFVLIMNPRLGSKRIKKEIIEDRDFIADFLETLFSDDFSTILDAEYEKLRKKLWGTISSYSQSVDMKPMEVKHLKGETALDLMEQNDELKQILAMFPRVEKLVRQNPNYIFGFLQYGLPFLEQIYGKVLK